MGVGVVARWLRLPGRPSRASRTYPSSSSRAGRDQHGQTSSGAGFAYLAEAAARWVAYPRFRGSRQRTPWSAGLTRSGASSGAGLAYPGRTRSRAGRSYPSVVVAPWPGSTRANVVARWPRLHRMKPSRTCPATTRSVALAAGIRGAVVFDQRRAKPAGPPRAGYAYPQVCGRAAVLPGDEPVQSTAQRVCSARSAFRCSMQLVARSAVFLNHRSSASGPEDPRAYCSRALEKILGGGQGMTVSCGLLRCPLTPGRDLFRRHADIKDTGRALAELQAAGSSPSLRSGRRQAQDCFGSPH